MTFLRQDAGTDACRSLATFTNRGYDKGRGVLWQASWFAVMNLIFAKWWCPVSWRVWILRAFGAEIGENVVVRHRVRVLWPWKLRLGRDSWVGEGVWLLNLEPISIGRDVCLSQEAFLCTGSHDRRSTDFRFDNGPIQIHDGAWIAAQAMVLRGSEVGRNAVIGARALVAGKVEPGTLVPAGARA